MRIAYVDGRYVPIDQTAIHIEDRGYQFSDAVYEVCVLVDGALWDADGHLARLRRSLGELDIPVPMSDGALLTVFRETARRNRLKTTLIYLQVSRGVGARDHAGDWSLMAPVTVVTARPLNLAAGERAAERGVSVITHADDRWARPDIKTVSLLPNILAKAQARDEGAAEAWLVRDGRVTEGSSTNAWIVKDGALITHVADREILRGITRDAVLEVASEAGLRVEERSFTVEEALQADEAFITSATKFVTPVVKIDGRNIGGGAPGPLAKRLRRAYIDRARAGAR